MSILANRRKRKRYNLVPRGKALYEDANRFGTRMLEKMGWSRGKGLGIKEDGNKEFVRIRYKNDNTGFGYEDRDDQWTQHEDDFNCLLRSLHNSAENSASEEYDCSPTATGLGFEQKFDRDKELISSKISGESLEEKSKMSRARVHYKKFTKGKDISQYSEKDLANIFGKKHGKRNSNDAEQEVTYSECKEESASKNFGVITFSSEKNMKDYFENKKRLKPNYVEKTFSSYDHLTKEAISKSTKKDLKKRKNENCRINVETLSEEFNVEKLKCNNCLDDDISEAVVHNAAEEKCSNLTRVGEKKGEINTLRDHHHKKRKRRSSTDETVYIGSMDLLQNEDIIAKSLSKDIMENTPGSNVEDKNKTNNSKKHKKKKPIELGTESADQQYTEQLNSMQNDHKAVPEERCAEKVKANMQDEPVHPEKADLFQSKGILENTPVSNVEDVDKTNNSMNHKKKKKHIELGTEKTNQQYIKELNLIQSNYKTLSDESGAHMVKMDLHDKPVHAESVDLLQSKGILENISESNVEDADKINKSKKHKKKRNSTESRTENIYQLYTEELNVMQSDHIVLAEESCADKVKSNMLVKPVHSQNVDLFQSKGILKNTPDSNMADVDKTNKSKKHKKKKMSIELGIENADRQYSAELNLGSNDHKTLSKERDIDPIKINTQNVIQENLEEKVVRNLKSLNRENNIKEDNVKCATVESNSKEMLEIKRPKENTIATSNQQHDEESKSDGNEAQDKDIGKEPVYRLSAFTAEKFRYTDLSRFKGSNISKIIGYGLAENITLEIYNSTQDAERITDLWRCAIDKYKLNDTKEVPKKKKKIGRIIKGMKRRNVFKIV